MASDTNYDAGDPATTVIVRGPAMMSIQSVTSSKLMTSPTYRVLAIAIAVFGISCFGNPALSQNQPEFFLPKEHTSKNGNSKITLIFVALDGDYLTVVTPKGKEVETSLKHFSRESQLWFKTAEKYRRQYVKRVEAFEKKIAYLDGAPSRRKFFYRAIVDYPDISWMAERDLLKLAANREENIAERFTAICAFASIARITEEHFDILYRIATDSKLALHKAIASNPEPFIPSLSRFGEQSEAYLIHVACTGELVPPPEDSEKKDANKKDEDDEKKEDKDKKQVVLATKPVILATTSGPKNRIRAAAILGLGGLVDSRKVSSLLATLFRKAETRINGQQDLISTKAILLAVGKMGKAPSSIRSRFKSLEKKFPDEVKFAEAGIKAASDRRKAEQQLSRLTRNVKPNRIFKDASGREVVFGKFLNFVDEFALFTNHKNEMIRIAKNNLSKADLKWIEAKTKETEKKDSEKK